MILTAEQLLRMPIDKHLWELEKEQEVTVDFFDGSITSSGGMTIVTRYIWTLLERYPDLPIKKEYHPATLGGFNTMFHARIAERIVLHDARDYYLGNGLPWDEQEEDRHVYIMANRISNMIDLFLQRHVLSVDAIDFAEICNHPDIAAVNDRIGLMDFDLINPDVIAEAHAAIKKVILNAADLADNPVVQLARQGLIKMPQLLISVGPIGYLTEINDVMFKYPVKASYVRGFSKLYEPMIESRNATIASMYQQILMRDSEYLSRKLSLIGEFIYNLHRVDCGSRRYVRQEITDKRKLEAMEGIFMKINDRHELLPIRSDMKHLIGKTVEIRAPNKCEHPDRSGVCEVCFSELAIQIPDLHLEGDDKILGGDYLQISTNIGHTCVVAVTSEVSQGVLSTKHNKELKSAQRLELTVDEEFYVQLDDEGRALYIRDSKNFDVDDLVLVISENDAGDIHEIQGDESEKLTASKLTSIVEFGIFNKKTGDRVEIYIGEDTRAGFLSRDALNLVGNEGYEVHSKTSTVHIELKGWNKKHPLIIIPQISYSPVEAIGDLENMVLSIKGKKSKPGLNGYATVDEQVTEMYELLKDKYVHLTHIMMIILAVSAQDPDNGDYRIPMPRDSGKPCSDTKLMGMRSMGSALAYENHASLFSDPQSYVNGKRQPHQYDYHMKQPDPY